MIVQKNNHSLFRYIPIGTNKSPFGNQQVVASPKSLLIYSHARRAQNRLTSTVLYHTHRNGERTNKLFKLRQQSNTLDS